MCAAPLVVGIATAVIGAVGSIAQYQQQQAAVESSNQAAQYQADLQNAVNRQQVDYQNAVARQQTEFQNAVATQQADFSNAVALQQFEVQKQAFEQSEQSFFQQIDLNNQAASRAYMSEQVKLNFEQKKAALEAHQLMASSTQAQGKILASGRSGQSLGMLANDASRETSRDLATLGLSLGYAQQDYFSSTQSIFEQVQSSQNIAQGNRMLAPVAPLKASPVLAGTVLAPDPIGITAMKSPGPGALGLVAGIAGAGLSGFNAYSSLKAPSSSSVPRPTPIPGGQLPGGRAGTVVRWT
jgi:hypothetical protein